MRKIASRPPHGRLPSAAKSFSHDLDPGKTFVSHRDKQIGRLRHYRPIRTPTLHDRLNPKALMLLVGDRRNDQLSRLQSARVGQCERGAYHGRDATLHILGSAAVKSTVAFYRVEWGVHAINAHRVDMTTKHECPPRFLSLEHGHNIWASDCNLTNRDLCAGSDHCSRNDAGDFLLARAARH